MPAKVFCWPLRRKELATMWTTCDKRFPVFSHSAVRIVYYRELLLHDNSGAENPLPLPSPEDEGMKARRQKTDVRCRRIEHALTPPLSRRERGDDEEDGGHEYGNRRRAGERATDWTVRTRKMPSPGGRGETSCSVRVSSVRKYGQRLMHRTPKGRIPARLLLAFYHGSTRILLTSYSYPAAFLLASCPRKPA